MAVRDALFGIHAHQGIIADDAALRSLPCATAMLVHSPCPEGDTQTGRTAPSKRTTRPQCAHSL